MHRATVSTEKARERAMLAGRRAFNDIEAGDVKAAGCSTLLSKDNNDGRTLVSLHSQVPIEKGV